MYFVGDHGGKSKAYLAGLMLVQHYRIDSEKERGSLFIPVDFPVSFNYLIHTTK